MKDYVVNISLNKSWQSNVEASSQDEAIQKALEEWEELAMVDENYLDITVDEVYDNPNTQY